MTRETVSFLNGNAGYDLLYQCVAFALAHTVAKQTESIIIHVD
jgi:hypothetical protein